MEPAGVVQEIIVQGHAVGCSATASQTVGFGAQMPLERSPDHVKVVVVLVMVTANDRYFCATVHLIITWSYNS